MFDGTDALNTESVPSKISYKSFKTLPMQNSYCDHRNFDSVNQPLCRLQHDRAHRYEHCNAVWLISHSPSSMGRSADTVRQFTYLRHSLRAGNTPVLRSGISLFSATYHVGTQNSCYLHIYFVLSKPKVFKTVI
jgi:hypothetical protein